MRFFISIAAIVLFSSSGLAQSKKAMGLLFLDQGQYQSIPPAPPPLAGPPPAVVDLSAYGYFPEPGDQGNQGSCVGWAVAYGLKSYQKNREYRLQNLQANFRFSPAFVYNQVKQKTCNGGSFIPDALEIIASQGALPWEKFSYDEKHCDSVPTESQVQSAWEYRIAKWMRVNVQSLAEMKAQISRGFPVVIGMGVYQSFVDWSGGGVYKTTKSSAGTYAGGHAMLVVGYADQLKAYKVLNSWGTKWGDKGYAWIDYSTFQNMTVEGYVTIDIFLDRIAAVAAPGPGAAPKVDAAPKAKVGAPKNETAPQAPPAATKLNKKVEAPAKDNVPTKPILTAAPAPTALTPEVLAKAVRSTTEPKILFNWNGYNVQPYSVWLELPDKLAASISKAQYWFNHPSFKNPKHSISGSNIFIAKWSGYGCINDAKVIVFLKDGTQMEAPFDLCAVQSRF